MLLALAIGSSIVAAVMSIIVWRMSRAQHARSAVRVETLARAIDGEAPAPFDLSLRTADRPVVPVRHGPVLSAPLSAPSSSAGSRLGLSLAVGAFAVTTAAAAAIVFSSDTPPTASRPPAAAPQSAAAAAEPQLELVSLDHERAGDSLTVRGIVRNPAVGVELPAIAAVVSTVGPDGGALAVIRAPIDVPVLAPGAQSAFSVIVPKANGVGRYRVSFRSGDRVVPHVDMRNGS
jgi:hypothetical protein